MVQEPCRTRVFGCQSGPVIDSPGTMQAHTPLVEADNGRDEPKPLSKNVKMSSACGVIGYGVAVGMLFSGWTSDMDLTSVLLFTFGCLGLGLASLIISLTCFVLAGEGHKCTAGTVMLVLFVVDLGLAISMLSGTNGAPIMGIIFGIYGLMGSAAVGILAFVTFCCCGSSRKKATTTNNTASANNRPAAAASGPVVVLRPWLLQNGFGELVNEVGDLTREDALSVSKDEFVAAYRGVGPDSGSRALRLASLYNRLAASGNAYAAPQAVAVPVSYQAAPEYSQQPPSWAPPANSTVPVATAPPKGGYAPQDNKGTWA